MLKKLFGDLNYKKILAYGALGYLAYVIFNSFNNKKGE